MRPAAAALLAALALAACGGEDGEPAPERPARIATEGSTTADERIAADLVRYVGRGCRAAGSFQEFSRGIARAEEGAAALLEFAVRRYGSLRAAFDAAVRRCEAIRRVRVDRGAITVETSLGGEPLDDVIAVDTCDLIQASDVADFTPGHRVLGADGRVLATCLPRGD